jgi:hypothetical protein
MHSRRTRSSREVYGLPICAIAIVYSDTNISGSACAVVAFGSFSAFGQHPHIGCGRRDEYDCQRDGNGGNHHSEIIQYLTDYWYIISATERL